MSARVTRRARALALTGAAAAAACAPPTVRRVSIGAEAFAPRGRGHLFIVGGGPRPRALNERFVALAGGPRRARIVVFPMATADTTAGPEVAAAFRALGADARNLPITRAAADSAGGSWAGALDSATGIWFLGGDQNRITAAIGGTAVERAIHRRYEAGAVVGGTSAGAAVLSATMITGEERRPGGARPPRDSSQAWLTIDRGNVVTTRGLGLLRSAVVDQHFVRRRRNNRLLSVVLETPERFGVGVDESTALVVEPSGRWSVHGESVVVVYDARPAAVTTRGALGAVGVLVHVLVPGSTYDPRVNAITFP